MGLSLRLVAVAHSTLRRSAAGPIGCRGATTLYVGAGHWQVDRYVRRARVGPSAWCLASEDEH